jgi:hypothetical protein
VDALPGARVASAHLRGGVVVTMVGVDKGVRELVK